MRDKRFIAVHRGGTLERADHVLLARWAVDCAERALHLFTQHSSDSRPLHALETGRAWANGEVKTGVAMTAALAAHAAARAATDKAAIAAARAAGHAVAAAHAADHSMGALLYALKALQASGGVPQLELKSQLKKLPPHLRECVSAGINARLNRMGIQIRAAKFVSALAAPEIGGQQLHQFRLAAEERQQRIGRHARRHGQRHG